MLHRPPILLLGFVALVGCLDEGPAPAGRHLFHSQNLESPYFISMGDDWFVRFKERRSDATPQKGGVYDLWISSRDGQTQRNVVTNWSDRWPELYHADGRYFVTEERTIPSGGGTAVVGTLIRLGPTFEEEARIDEVSTQPPALFGAPLSWIYDAAASDLSCPGFPERRNDCPQALFERPPPVGQGFPILYLWDGANQIPIGPDSGGFRNQITGDGSIYCVLGDNHTLSRLSRPGNKLDSLRDNVSNFSLSGDQHYVALSLTNDSKTMLRDLRSGVEVTPPHSPSSWGGFGGDTFIYWSGPELHQFDIVTGEDVFITLPAPLKDQVAVMNRPNSDEALRIDSLGNGVFTGRNDYVGRRTIMGPLLAPGFTADGDYLIYIRRATSTLYDPDPQGALMFQDADLKYDPIQLSPPGLLLGIKYQVPYFFTGEGKVLAFWAHLGRAASDLYFADYQPGAPPTNLRLMVRSIMSVSVSAHDIFGIVNVSQQDDVGDLVYRDLDQGTEIRYAQAVSDAAQLGGSDLSTSWTVYNVRGRADSDRSGIWVTTLAPPVPDGGTN
jgi:hypothetical protein